MNGVANGRTDKRTAWRIDFHRDGTRDSAPLFNIVHCNSLHKVYRYYPTAQIALLDQQQVTRFEDFSLSVRINLSSFCQVGMFPSRNLDVNAFSANETEFWWVWDFEAMVTKATQSPEWEIEPPMPLDTAAALGDIHLPGQVIPVRCKHGPSWRHRKYL